MHLQPSFSLQGDLNNDHGQRHVESDMDYDRGGEWLGKEKDNFKRFITNRFYCFLKSRPSSQFSVEQSRCSRYQGQPKPGDDHDVAAADDDEDAGGDNDEVGDDHDADGEDNDDENYGNYNKNDDDGDDDDGDDDDDTDHLMFL